MYLTFPTDMILKCCSCNNKEHSMDNIKKALNSAEQPKTRASNKKGKWREIEQLKEKFQLERDLKVYEDSLEYMLDEF